VISIIQLVFCAFIIIAWFVSKFPLYYKFAKQQLVQKYGEKALTLFSKLYIIIWQVIILQNEVVCFILNIVFLIIQDYIHGYVGNSLQLLLIINLSVTLKNIIKAITHKWKAFLATVLFIFVVINIFALVAFFYLRHNYKELPDEVCSTLFYCFITHLNLGLRTDGGIGEDFEEIPFNNDTYGKYFSNFFFIMLFFILVWVLLMAIVFGTVIDSFAELMDHMNRIEHDKTSVCFVCGEGKDEEKRGENFKKHVEEIHNTWNYIYYIIGLKFVDIQETNAINSYAIEMIDKKSISWVPAEKDETSASGGHH